MYCELNVFDDAPPPNAAASVDVDVAELTPDTDDRLWLDVELDNELPVPPVAVAPNEMSDKLDTVNDIS